MEIKDLTFIDEKTGREIAIREGINLYIVPSISEIGNRYAITAKIMEAKSGNLLKSGVSYAETQVEILSGLDQLSKRIRRDLGESRYNIAIQDKPLSNVTTSSLEALRLYSMGIERHSMSDFEAARDYYEGALRIDTGFTAARASLGGINIERFNPVKGRELLSQAVKSIENLTERERLAILAFHAVNIENNIPKGIKYTRILIELYPDDATAHNNMGWYYQNAGEFEKAVKEYKEAIWINRNLAIAYNGLLWIYLDYLGNADSALVWSEKMRSDNPGNAWSYINLGAAWICMDSITKAKFCFQKAREINPDLLINLYRLAHTCSLQENYNEAIQILKHIPELNKNEFIAYYYSGASYQAMGNMEEGRKNFSGFKKFVTEEWVKKWPDNAESYIWLGKALARLGDMDYSQQMLMKAIEIDSTLHYRFAEVLCLQGKISEALNQLEQAFDNGYRDLFWLKISPDLQILHYDIRFRNLLDKFFK
jgi:tetratricopeptide (TPR) repeat protein